MKTLDEISRAVGLLAIFGGEMAVAEVKKLLDIIRTDIQAMIDASAMWTLCSERMPDDEREVLVTVSGANGGYPFTTVASWSEGRKKWLDEQRGEVDCNGYVVTAWHFLPKPWEPKA